MTTYKYAVEDGVPLAAKRGGGHHRLDGRRHVYPFPVMAIGQSFFVPLTDTDALGGTRIAEAIKSYRMRDDARQFAYRRRYLAEDGEEGFRVWRIA